MNVLELLRLVTVALAAAELLIMATRWHAWPVLSEPMRWIFMGLAGQAAANIYGTWELFAASIPAGPRSYFSVLTQAWLLIGIVKFMPRGARLRTRLRRWRSQSPPKET